MSISIPNSEVFMTSEDSECTIQSRCNELYDIDLEENEDKPIKTVRRRRSESETSSSSAGTSRQYSRHGNDHHTIEMRQDTSDLTAFNMELALLEARDKIDARRSYVLDGVSWAKGVSRSFERGFKEGLRDVDLPGAGKLIVMDRYLALAHKYRRSRTKWKWLSHSARVIVTVGSLMVPALITLDDEIRDRSPTSQILAYTVFGLSLTVSIINGLHEYFAATNRYVTAETTRETLETEGWSFLALSGRYKRFNNHSTCLKPFLERVERIHAAAVDLNVSLLRRPADDEKSGMGHKNRGYSLMHLDEENEKLLSSPIVYTDH